MHVRPLDVSKDLSVVHSQLSLKQLKVPTFSWFEPWLPKSTELTGSGTLSANWARSGSSEPASGAFEAKLEQFSYASGDTSLRLSAELRSRVATAPEERVTFEGFELNLSDVLVASADERSGSWNARVRSNSARVLEKGPAFQGTFDVNIDRTRALLPLFLPDMPSSLAASVLGLGALEGRLAIYFGSGLTRLEVLKAQSGPLNLTGAWQKAGGEGAGAFLLQNKLLNFGIRVKGDDTDVSIGADADFVSQAGPP
jgi:hypothetical protein